MQHTRVSLVQLLDDSGPARPAAATQAAATGRPHLRVDTHTCSPRKAKQVTPRTTPSKTTAPFLPTL